METHVLFAFINWDKGDSSRLRTDLRPVHREYLGAAADHIAFAGPLLADDGQTVNGSLLVLDFPTRKDAEEWLAAEPYTKAGLYSTTAVHLFENRWPQRTGFVAG
jgi:uncharacterized protein YciI